MERCQAEVLEVNKTEVWGESYNKNCCLMINGYRHNKAYICPQVMEMTRQAAEHRAQNLLRELEEEIAELKKKSTALSQLALSEDYIHFLKV